METQGYATCLRTLVCDNVGDFHHDGDAVNYGVEGGIERDDAPAARSRKEPYSIFWNNMSDYVEASAWPEECGVQVTHDQTDTNR